MAEIYFNEHEAFPGQWLRRLFPDATVDERDIRDVTVDDVRGFAQCHFFGGIGGWRYALQLAGWPDEWPVWTGSCPCQPLSCAGRRGGEKDERHLWPELYRLISECRPATVFGEQVASKDGLEWLDGISLDLEELGYAVASADLPAASVGTPHIRQRAFWAASRVEHANYTRRSQAWQSRRSTGRGRLPCTRRGAFGLGNTNFTQRGDWWAEQREQWGPVLTAGSEVDGLSNTGGQGLAGRQIESTQQECQATKRSYSTAICRDGKFRRVPTEPSFQPLAHGIPRDLGRRFPELRQLAKSARANRVGRLKGYGNAIIPQLAAVFIQAFMEAADDHP